MLSRRGIIGGAAGIGGLGLTGSVALGMVSAFTLPSQACGCVKTVEEWCAEIEAKTGQRIGVQMIIPNDAYQDSLPSYRADERFAMCSTFKWVLAAAILKAADDGKVKLTQAVSFSRSDLLDHVPVARANLAKGRLTVSELCAAAVTVSDNTAANLLFPLVGGPKGLTKFVRSLGDKVTRFDRTEIDLNSNRAGDPRDTTTPRAMAILLQRVFTGSVISKSSLALLKQWMVTSSTGREMIRAGVPKRLQPAVIGDKTGRGANGAVNDVAVMWRNNEPPLFLSIYTSGGRLSAKDSNRVVAGVAEYALTFG